jgi:hypothetical protein
LSACGQCAAKRAGDVATTPEDESAAALLLSAASPLPPRHLQRIVTAPALPASAPATVLYRQRSSGPSAEASGSPSAMSALRELLVAGEARAELDREASADADAGARARASARLPWAVGGALSGSGSEPAALSAAVYASSAPLSAPAPPASLFQPYPSSSSSSSSSALLPYQEDLSFAQAHLMQQVQPMLLHHQLPPQLHAPPPPPPLPPHFRGRATAAALLSVPVPTPAAGSTASGSGAPTFRFRTGPPPLPVPALQLPTAAFRDPRAPAPAAPPATGGGGHGLYTGELAERANRKRQAYHAGSRPGDALHARHPGLLGPAAPGRGYPVAPAPEAPPEAPLLGTQLTQRTVRYMPPLPLRASEVASAAASAPEPAPAPAYVPPEASEVSEDV